MSAKKTTKTTQAQSAKAMVATNSNSRKKTQSATAGSNGDRKSQKLSAIDAAAKLLGETGEPMSCKELIDAMATKGLWTSPGGKTPHATLYSAILREIASKGKDARFKKAERGKFVGNK
jgi:hypothetical protein